jgi:acyl carrier protein
MFGQDDKQFSNDQSFLERGLIDSTGVLELIGFLESTYGISINDDELVPANLDSVDRVAAFVDTKCKTKVASLA